MKRLKLKEEKKIKKKRERDEKLRNYRGYLAKQGHVVKNWHIRYFVIRDKEMFYYMFNNEKKLKVILIILVLIGKGFLQLEGSVVHVSADMDGMQKYVFLINVLLLTSKLFFCKERNWKSFLPFCSNSTRTNGMVCHN